MGVFRECSYASCAGEYNRVSDILAGAPGFIAGSSDMGRNLGLIMGFPARPKISA